MCHAMRSASRVRARFIIVSGERYGEWASIVAWRLQNCARRSESADPAVARGVDRGRASRDHLRRASGTDVRRMRQLTTTWILMQSIRSMLV